MTTDTAGRKTPAHRATRPKPSQSVLPSVLVPTMPDTTDTLRSYAELVRDTGARRLWAGQSLLLETHQAFAHLAGSDLRVPVGTSVTLMPLRHPYEAALQARSLALTTGRTVVAGYGVGEPAFARSLNGRPYTSPLAMASDYLRMVRSLLDGEVVDHFGDYHVLQGRLIPMEHPKVEVGVGVLRPNMARTAGRVADVAITWMTPPGYVSETLMPSLEEGGKNRDARCRVATVVHVAVERSGRDPYVLAYMAASGHLAADHYVDMLRRAGVPTYPSNPKAGAIALVDSGTYVFGSADHVAARLDDYRNAGVDEVILNCAGVLFTEGREAAFQDAREIIDAVRRRHGD
ncbi:LLM class flavin-dependent oxidoreductase [Streptomyces brasiliscabiei]|uniref:LLM class flavin-dependent oxidoreductase n=1 Tax=Streptomyces brasiliscabiei TaxID=2736302 RepID=UPI0027E0D58A|nr:LLM class flavin-dependent oxidoreductase [Streptomyces brasiliscabiei]